MSIKKEPLKDIYKTIRDEVIDTLKNHEKLSEVNDVKYGERHRIGTMKSPAIWIVPEPYEPQLVSGRTAQHDIPFNFVILFKDSEPKRGLQNAQDLAMTVYDVIVEDRTLNGLVYDIRPSRIDPAYEAGNNTQLYWSAVQFIFRLQRRE